MKETARRKYKRTKDRRKKEQKDIGVMSNQEEGGGEKENDKEHKTEQDTQWMEMEISDSYKSLLEDVDRDGQGMEDQTKETDSEEVKMDNTGIDRGARGQLRITLKVKPNLEKYKKKENDKGPLSFSFFLYFSKFGFTFKVKSVNGYEVLRGLEGEDG